jgi:uncharacterized protein YqgV (UPF0045/DUF77 family)
MKFLILLLITFPVFACQIQVPTSEAQRYIEAMPNGVPPLYSCTDKPEEVCHCADAIIWEQAELVTEISGDSDHGIIEMKVLKNSESKKAAHEAKVKADKDAEELKVKNKKDAKLAIKDKVKNATTIKKLSDVFLEYLEAQE